MRTLFRHVGWLIGVFLIPGQASEALGAAVGTAVHDLTGFYHTKWTSSNGLGSVFDIKQSSDGYLWLTTSKGVLRFDGVRFQSVEAATYGAVGNNEIDSVFLSSSGGLWLTTERAGLLFWDHGQLTEFPDRSCTPIRTFGQLIEDRDGSLWVQAAAGLFHLRGSVCEQVGEKQGYPGGFAAGMLMASNGTLWVKTRTGTLWYLPRGQSKFQRSKYGEGPATNYAFLHEGPDGAIWLSDDQGLRPVTTSLGASAFSPSPERPLPGKSDKRKSQFGDFTFGPDGSLWAVTPNGVRRFDHVDEWLTPLAVDAASGKSFTRSQGLSSDAAWKVLVDREGTVWVATNSGLDRLLRTVFSGLALPDAQEREYGVAAGDRGSVWIGNSNVPLTHVAADGSRTSFPPTRQVLCVRRDRQGAIWSAGEGKFHLWRFSTTGFSSLHYPEEDLDPVYSIAVDRHNDPWIITGSGRVYRFSNGTWSNQNEALGRKPGVIGAMTDDQAGNIWFGFSDKIVRWDGSTYHTFVRNRDPGVSETTMSVRGDHVWLGGEGGAGLFTQSHFQKMRWKDRDLPGRVSGIVETATGDLWLNGFSGATHVSAAELNKWLSDPGYAVSAERLDEVDGLPGLSGERIPEPSVVEGRDGRLWFATTKGVAWLDPAALERTRNRLAPPVIVSTVISDAATHAGWNGLNLPARTTNLEIDYTALSLAIPERVLFRYKLDGVDNEWQDAGTRRRAFYTKLGPGAYKFHVIACNNDGVWNDAGATLDFSISPAWFQTTWFRLSCVACGIFLLLGLYQLRIRQIAAGINARFDERLAERTRVAQELHDTLLQGFLSASMQVHLATDSLPEDSEVRPILTRALQIMSQVNEEGRNAVRGLRSSRNLSLDLEDACARIQQELDPENQNGTQVGFRVISEGVRRPLRPLLRDELYRIVREALANAFRHAQASQIEVILTYSSHQLRLSVRDDGHGIDPEVLRSGREGHWGLPGMRERAERIGARLRVFSSGSGTEIDLCVPGRVAFEDQPRSKSRWLRWLSRKKDAGDVVHRRGDG